MPDYPAKLEAWWLDEARRFTRAGDDRSATLKLAPAAEQLSNLFTSERVEHFGDYGRRPELLRAYGLYAFPQTFVRTQFVLRELCALHSPPPPGRVLDLGCGTGAASAAVRDFFPDGAMEFTLCDQSGESLQIAERLLRENWPATPTRSFRSNARDWPIPESFDLILCSFALGELFYQRPLAALLEWIRRVSGHLRAGGWLILLEPALQETAGRLIEARDALAAEGGWQIAAPCPHTGPCPLRAEGKYWCHEVRGWSVPASLQRINRPLGRSVHELKFSFLVIRPGEPAETDLARLVAPVSKLKGRWATRACAPGGKLVDIVVPKSAVGDNERLALKSLERGDRVRLREDSLDWASLAAANPDGVPG